MKKLTMSSHHFGITDTVRSCSPNSELFNDIWVDICPINIPLRRSRSMWWKSWTNPVVVRCHSTHVML